MEAISEAGQSVVIEVHSDIRANPSHKLTGTVQERIGKSLTLVTGEEIAQAADIWVQSKNFVSLGKVQSSFAQPGAEWNVHVIVSRSFLVL